MAAVARPRRSVREIKQALTKLDADGRKTDAHGLLQKVQKRRDRRELCFDVAQYLGEWMPGEVTCLIAWLERNDITAEELQEKRQVAFSTVCAERSDRLRRAIKIGSRFYAEWKLNSWVQTMNHEHGIAPPSERVYEEFHWKLAGQRHRGEA